MGNFCTSCGTRAEDHAQFCIKCGAKIDAPTGPPTQKTQPRPASQPAAVHVTYTNTAPQSAADLHTRKQKTKNTLIITAVILCVLLLIGSVYGVFADPAEEPDAIAGVTESAIRPESRQTPAQEAQPAQSETKANTETRANTPETSPAPQGAGYYTDGMYRAGADIPAGEYVVFATNAAFPCYFEVTSDSSGAFSSIVVNKNITGRCYITVQNGQYIRLQRGKMITAAKAPKADVSSGVLPAGMYKCGVDFPPGEYRIRQTGSFLAYMEVASSSSGLLSSIVANDNFNGERYVTVQAGQYLTITNGELIPAQ